MITLHFGTEVLRLRIRCHYIGALKGTGPIIKSHLNLIRQKIKKESACSSEALAVLH